MKRLCLSALALCAIGCGGSGGIIPNVYVGTYTGTFSAPSTGQSGTVQMIVDQSGNLTGNTVTSGTNVDTSITGSVDDTGAMTGSLTQTGTNTVDGFTGQLTITPPTATAALQVVVGTSTVADTWTFTNVTSGFSSRKGK